MLHSSAVGMSQIVNQTLTQKNLKIEALPGTALEALTDLSTADIQIQNHMRIDGAPVAVDVSASLESAANVPEEGASLTQHDVVMDQSIDILADRLAGLLDVAQNVVNPTIRRVYDFVDAELLRSMPVSEAPFTIIKKRPPAMLRSILLRESVARHVAGPATDMLTRDTGAAQPSDLKEILTTGHQAMDELIQQEIIEGCGYDYLMSVWDQLFKVGSSLRAGFSADESALGAVAGYFMASHAHVNVPAGVQMNLAEWRAYTAGLVATLGCLIMEHIERADKSAQYGSMVLRVPVSGARSGEIIVDGARFDNWCARGGSEEILLGAYIHDSRLADPDSLLANAEMYAKAWGMHCGMFNSNRTADRLTIVQQALQRALASEVVTQLTEEECPAAHDKINSFCYSLTLHELDKLWEVCRAAVCQIIFPNSDAGTLLISIDAQSKKNPDLEQRELALLASIDIMAKWLCSSMTVCHNP